MKEKVALAVSGGIDSSTAAYTLKKAGYDVIGVNFEFWKWKKEKETELKNQQLLKQTMKTIGVPLVTMNNAELFKTRVVDQFLYNLQAGGTPNPCVVCNPSVKFQLLKEFADAEGIHLISTGHYARIINDMGVYKLLTGIDSSKDQSYMLCYLNQEFLARLIFPLGATYKKQNVALMESIGLHVNEIEESQDLCFIDPKHLKTFISNSVSELNQPGNIVDNFGNQLGNHEGLIYYTIGQRKGIKVAAVQPYYVIRKNISDNELVVGFLDELGEKEFLVRELNWISSKPVFPLSCDVKIRYRSPATACTIMSEKENKIKVNLDEKIRDITPGQYAVFYEGDELLGGGKIDSIEKKT